MRLPRERTPIEQTVIPALHTRRQGVLTAVISLPVLEDQETAGAASAKNAAYRPGDLIYALGTLDYDFGSEARRDFLVQYMRLTSPADRNALMTYLDQNPSEAEWLTWTVNVDGVPICALNPAPTFGRDVYAWLRRAFSHPGHEHVEEASESSAAMELLVSIPGVITGGKMLADGQVVPAVDPMVGGLFAWEQSAIERAELQGSKVDKEVHAKILRHIELFQRSASRELRNLGRSPRERAVNYAVTAAFQTTEVQAMAFIQTQIEANRQKQEEEATRSETRRELTALRQLWREKGALELSHLDVSPSPICRPDSGANCWDVKLVLFDPAAGRSQSGTVYQFIVDVGERMPVVIGEMAQWSSVLAAPRS